MGALGFLATMTCVCMGRDTAVSDPLPFVAVTRTRTYLLTSPATGVYVDVAWPLPDADDQAVMSLDTCQSYA